MGIAVLLTCLIVGCDRKSEPATEPPKKQQSSKSAFDIEYSEPSEESKERVSTGVRLTQVQEQAGLRHVYQNGQQGRALLVETIGGGAGWIDFDCDGRLDLYLNQGGDPTIKAVEGQPLDQLFRNVDEREFKEVSQNAGIIEPYYSQGVGVADFDNDGFQDVYITNVGTNTFWHNCGDGTFVEMADQAGISDPRWGASTAWADLDKDGDLDLYVCNYCVYDPFVPTECKDSGGFDTLCNPAELEPWADACFINNGDGTFVDEAASRGLLGPGNRALGVAIADFDGDAWPDIYVANDTTENFLFVNTGEGNFFEEAQLRGCAVDRVGASQGSMGVGVYDYDRNGLLDLYVAHYFEESNTLYANLGERGFRDQTAATGLHQPTLSSLAFGCVFLDLDADSLPEVFIANGHVNNSTRAKDPRMKPQIFAYNKRGRWNSIASQAGDVFQHATMGRGAATGDYDGDHDLDVVVVNQNDSVSLLRNDSKQGNWLRLSFRGAQSNRFGIGCTVTIAAGNTAFVQQVCGGTSYCVSNEPTLLFGLGEIEGEVAGLVTWPSGQEQEFKSLVNTHVVLDEPR